MAYTSNGGGAASHKRHDAGSSSDSSDDGFNNLMGQLNIGGRAVGGGSRPLGAGRLSGGGGGQPLRRLLAAVEGPLSSDDEKSNKSKSNNQNPIHQRKSASSVKDGRQSNVTPQRASSGGGQQRRAGSPAVSPPAAVEEQQKNNSSKSTNSAGGSYLIAGRSGNNNARRDDAFFAALAAADDTTTGGQSPPSAGDSSPYLPGLGGGGSSPSASKAKKPTTSNSNLAAVGNGGVPMSEGAIIDGHIIADPKSSNNANRAAFNNAAEAMTPSPQAQRRRQPSSGDNYAEQRRSASRNESNTNVPYGGDSDRKGRRIGEESPTYGTPRAERLRPQQQQRRAGVPSSSSMYAGNEDSDSYSDDDEDDGRPFGESPMNLPGVGKGLDAAQPQQNRPSSSATALLHRETTTRTISSTKKTFTGPAAVAPVTPLRSSSDTRRRSSQNEHNESVLTSVSSATATPGSTAKKKRRTSVIEEIDYNYAAPAEEQIWSPEQQKQLREYRKTDPSFIALQHSGKKKAKAKSGGQTTEFDAANDAVDTSTAGTRDGDSRDEKTRRKAIANRQRGDGNSTIENEEANGASSKPKKLSSSVGNQQSSGNVLVEKESTLAAAKSDTAAVVSIPPFAASPSRRLLEEDNDDPLTAAKNSVTSHSNDKNLLNSKNAMTTTASQPPAVDNYRRSPSGNRYSFDHPSSKGSAASPPKTAPPAASSSAQNSKNGAGANKRKGAAKVSGRGGGGGGYYDPYASDDDDDQEGDEDAASPAQQHTKPRIDQASPKTKSQHHSSPPPPPSADFSKKRQQPSSPSRGQGERQQGKLEPTSAAKTPKFFSPKAVRKEEFDDSEGGKSNGPTTHHQARQQHQAKEKQQQQQSYESLLQELDHIPFAVGSIANLPQPLGDEGYQLLQCTDSQRETVMVAKTVKEKQQAAAADNRNSGAMSQLPPKPTTTKKSMAPLNGNTFISEKGGGGGGGLKTVMVPVTVVTRERYIAVKAKEEEDVVEGKNNSDLSSELKWVTMTPLNTLKTNHILRLRIERDVMVRRMLGNVASSSASSLNKDKDETPNPKNIGRHPHIIALEKCFVTTRNDLVVVDEYCEGGELYEAVEAFAEGDEEEEEDEDDDAYGQGRSAKSGNRSNKKKKAPCRHPALRGTMPLQVAARLFTELITAVHHCHANGIAHRDIKLENILLDGENAVKLGNFGLSVACERDVGAVGITAHRVLGLKGAGDEKELLMQQQTGASDKGSSAAAAAAQRKRLQRSYSNPDGSANIIYPDSLDASTVSNADNSDILSNQQQRQSTDENNKLAKNNNNNNNNKCRTDENKLTKNNNSNSNNNNATVSKYRSCICCGSKFYAAPEVILLGVAPAEREEVIKIINAKSISKGGQGNISVILEEDDHDDNHNRGGESSFAQQQRYNTQYQRSSADNTLQISAITTATAAPNESKMNNKRINGDAMSPSSSVYTFSPHYDPRPADIWSCGVVLYSLLTGTLPFDGSSSSSSHNNNSRVSQEEETELLFQILFPSDHLSGLDGIVAMMETAGWGSGEEEEDAEIILEVDAPTLSTTAARRPLQNSMGSRSSAAVTSNQPTMVVTLCQPVKPSYKDAAKLIMAMLQRDPKKRPTASEIFKSRFVVGYLNSISLVQLEEEESEEADDDEENDHDDDVEEEQEEGEVFDDDDDEFKHEKRPNTRHVADGRRRHHRLDHEEDVTETIYGTNPTASVPTTVNNTADTSLANTSAEHNAAILPMVSYDAVTSRHSGGKLDALWW